MPPLPAVNHNPVWQVTVEGGAVLRVYACDELQASDWVRRARGLVVLWAVREVTDGGSDHGPEVDTLPDA